jgi:1,2-dihydroxy-3-keto-5-methylthiopentene dioxygenase
MAILQLENGSTYREIGDIDRELTPLNIQLQRWPVLDPVGDDLELLALLAEEQLEENEKNLILESLDRYFQQLQQDSGYQSRDLMVLHPAIPDLDMLMAKFYQTHTHALDEVRYVVAGEGVFGFVRPDGSQIELTVQAEEYINVPAGTEHWFHLSPSRTIKAVRYFIDTNGWSPSYTATPIRFQLLPHSIDV